MATYEDLARLAQAPQAQYPGMGPNALQGWMSGARNAEAKGYREQAAGIAQLEATRKAQEAEEFAMAAPGRRNEIERKNLESGDALDFAKSGAGKEQRQADIWAKLSEAQQKEASKKAHVFSAIANAEDDEQAEELLKYFGNETALGGKQPLSSLPVKHARALAKGILKGLVESPKQLGAERIVTTKEEGANTRAAASNVSREKVAAIVAQAKEVAASIAANASKAKAAVMAGKLDPGQLYSTYHKELTDAGKSILEANILLADFQQVVTELTPARIGAEAQGTEKAKQMENLLGGLKKKPASTAAPAVKPQFEEGKVYQDAKGNKARYKGGKWVPE